ncbi:MAG: hypothetical protein EKK64_00650 [Neisseriaceae bacterium]|nr:MAG: hypothetical protein EKK64_00650 [Neisseriaceae bacterium]
MLDISKKYWIRFFDLNIKCSIECASVCCRDLNSTKISNEAKEFFKNSDNPTAYSDDFNSIKYLEELEKEGYVVFYDVDEPIEKYF